MYKNISKQEYAVFLFACAIFTMLATPTVNTGDSGELVTSAYFLGISHPSGYPLYLLISKLFSLIPFGNIAFRIALVSVVASSLCLMILYRIVYKITEIELTGVFSVVVLFGAFSYVTQSVITKFYPLNLLLVCIVVVFWVDILCSVDENNNDIDHLVLKKLVLIFFVLGLISGTHHIGIIVLIPVFISAIISFRKHLFCLDKKIAMVLLGKIISAFILGFAINLYLYFRGGYDIVSNVFHVTSIKELFYHISRQVYGVEATSTLAGSLLHNPFESIFHGFKHFFTAIIRNFSISALFAIPGIMYLYRKNKSVLIFLLLCVFFFGPFITALRLPMSQISKIDYYIVIHQYFMPALWFFALFIGLGFAWFVLFFQRVKVQRYNLYFSIFCAFLCIIYILQRFEDSNYRTNFVAYQSAKDIFSMLPERSIYFSQGDNERFVSRYLRLIGQYRKDVCLVSGVTLQRNVTGLDGCEKNSFATISPSEMKAEWDYFYNLSKNGLLYSSEVRLNAFPVTKRLIPFTYGPVFSWRISKNIQGMPNITPDVRLLSSFVCTEYKTVDLFTDFLCSKPGYRVRKSLKK